MKASNLQALYAERVQLLGFHHQQTLTDSAAMGVANARILHRNILSSNSNNNNNNNNNNNQNNSNQNDSNNNNSISNKSRAKRCLFGTPDPGEMETLYADSMKEKQKEFLERFSFDIMTGQPVVQDVPQCSVDSANLVNGREYELSEEDRMRFTGECRLQEGNLQSDNESCSDNETCNHQDKLSCCCASSTNATTTQSSPSGKDKRTNDRFKPYTKQTQITDYFATRKTVASIKAAHDQSLTEDEKPPKLEDGGEERDKV